MVIFIAYLFLASSLAQTEFADPIWQQFQTASTVYEYSRGTEFVTYEVAHARCQALNASLPLPSTLEENRFLRAIGGSFLRLVDSPNNLTSELGDGVHYDELTNARPTYTQYCASNTYLEGQPEPIYMEFNILPGCWRPRTYTESSAFTCIRKIGPISNFPPRLSQVEQNLATVTTEARQEINSTQLLIERMQQQISVLETSLAALNSSLALNANLDSSADAFGTTISTILFLIISF